MAAAVYVTGVTRTSARDKAAAKERPVLGVRRECRLQKLVSEQLDRAAEPDARSMADHFAAQPGTLAVLCYGNRLRHPAEPGLLDFYVLTDSDRAWSGPGIAAGACRLLPPNVYLVELAQPASAAKVAVMRLAAFRARMRRQGWDTTLWARFAQPAALLFARDAETRCEVVASIATAWRTAAWWADRLSEGDDRWAALFAATYGAELRVESAARAAAIARNAPELYAGIDRLLPPVRPSPAEIDAARHAWRRRHRVGRALNALRLAKAAMTFRGGMAYALAKVERHAGRGALTAWERRIPWLAAPVVLTRLVRRGGNR
jgi:hypothetical protein